MISRFNAVLHAEEGAMIEVNASCVKSQVYIMLRHDNVDMQVYLSWDQLDRLLFLGSVAAREHNDLLEAPRADLDALAAQYEDEINE